MAVVAALLIHMDMKAVRTMNPNMMEDGEAPDNIRALRASLLCRPTIHVGVTFKNTDRK